MTQHRQLTADEVTDRLKDYPGWRLVDGKLHRDLAFPDFNAAFGFMTRVALVAETMNHHPEWRNVYNRVTIDLTTHDVAGISDKDFALAARIDEFSLSS
jgi:4a-hydroxytetrahydrobiopterin dehydratase